MDNQKYSLDDIMADAKKIRAKKQLEKQKQSSFQKLDNSGYKKLRIGNTSEMSRMISKKPISDKGRLFYTMQLMQLKEDTMRSLRQKQKPIDVDKIMNQRDIKRKQVLSEVVKMSESTEKLPAQKPAFWAAQKHESDRHIAEEPPVIEKKAVSASKIAEPKMPEPLEKPSHVKVHHKAKAETGSDAVQKKQLQDTFEVRIINEISSNTTAFDRADLSDFKNTDASDSAPAAAPNSSAPQPPKTLDVGFVAQGTAEIALEQKRIKKATSFVLDDEIFSNITTGIPSDKINAKAKTSSASVPIKRDDFPKEQQEYKEEQADMFDGENIQLIKQDIYKNYVSNTLSVIVMAILSIFSLYISIAPKLTLPLPEIISQASNPFIFLCINIAVLVISILICHTTVFYGVINLFTFKADNDSLSAMATIAVLIQNLALVLSPSAINTTIGVNIYTPLVIICLFANKVGRMFATSRMVRNIKMAYSSAKNKYSTVFLPQETAHSVTNSKSSDPINVYAPAKTERFTNFIDNSVSEDLSDTISTVLAPIVFIASIVITIFCYFLYKDINLAFTAFAATLCICSPFSALIISNMPINKISKKLYPVGGIVSGFDSLEATAEAETVVVSAGDLFPKGTILLHDIKTFEQARIDEVLLDAASVICRVGGTLQDVFNQIIMNKDSILNEVDSIVYEDSMGVSAWINSKRVLIGNRELMQNHGINVPSQAYEQKHKRDDRELVYLSTSGTLTAMFVVSYNADETIRKALARLARSGTNICVKTSDANISSEKLSALFRIPAEKISIMPSESYKDYTEAAKKTRTSPIKVGFLGNVLGYLNAVTACKKARKSIFAATILQTAGIALGYVLVAYFSFMNGLTQIDIMALLIYQLFWFIITWAVVKFHSY